MKAVVCFAAAALMLLSSSGQVRADGMRCGNRLISTGSPMYVVQSRCGQPDDLENWTEYRSVRIKMGNVWVDSTVEVKFERWTYDFGDNRLLRFVVFEDGRVLRVDTGPYGERPAASTTGQ